MNFETKNTKQVTMTTSEFRALVGYLGDYLACLRGPEATPEYYARVQEMVTELRKGLTL